MVESRAVSLGSILFGRRVCLARRTKGVTHHGYHELVRRVIRLCEGRTCHAMAREGSRSAMWRRARIVSLRVVSLSVGRRCPLRKNVWLAVWPALTHLDGARDVVYVPPSVSPMDDELDGVALPSPPGPCGTPAPRVLLPLEADGGGEKRRGFPRSSVGGE